MSYSAGAAPDFDHCERALQPRAQLTGEHDTAVATALACVGCGGELDLAHQGLRCAGCGQHYPEVVFDDFRIPWLFADPDAAAFGWWQRLNTVRIETRDHRQRAFGALRAAGVTETTSRRIRREQRGRRAQLEEIEALLRPMSVLNAWRDADELSQDAAAVLPARQGLLSYSNSMYRDWCWGEEAPAAALDAVAQVLDPSAYGRQVLVMGAGSGRLALELHATGAMQQTTLLDFNPLLLAVAARMARGRPLRLHELPFAPLGIDQVAVERQAQPLQETRTRGLRFVLADAQRAPFAPASFSTVVTPWLMDILEDPLSFPAAVNRLLEPGGHWIFTGSCVFATNEPRGQLSQDELLELVRDSGFVIEKVQRRLIPYACSGASAHRRQESVLTFHARKRKAAPTQPAAVNAPSDELAVESSARLTGACARHLLAAQVLGAVDGQRTVREIAALVATRYQLAPDVALVAVRDVLKGARNG